MPELTVEGFRREMKRLDVWPSNSMVAVMGEEPGAVSIGTKREREVMVHRIGVAHEHQRQGHGRHLLTSLSQKLAVLGPPRLVAEVPEAAPGACAFFEAVGYEQETVLQDHFRKAPPKTAPDQELFGPVTVDELESVGLLAGGGGRAWCRQPETLRNRATELTGVALASPDGVAAWALAAPEEAQLEILAVGPEGDSEAITSLLGFLLDHLQARWGLPLSLPRLAPDELAPELLSTLGFSPGARYRRYTAEAQPA
jgi:hypothetical protein